MRTLSIAICWIALLAALTAAPARALEVTKSFDFALEEWHELDASDGAVTLHRIRLNPQEKRLTKSRVFRPYNQEYLESVAIQLEYTNGSSTNWNARISARWLDEDGEVIDGFSGNEKLDKKAARKVTGLAVSTFRYGLEKAKTLEIAISFEP